MTNVFKGKPRLEKIIENPNSALAKLLDHNESQLSSQQYPEPLSGYTRVPSNMEKSPKINNERLPRNILVPRDVLLRGASPQEVLGAIRAAISVETPAPKGVQFLLVRDEADYLKIEQRWARTLHKMGIKNSKKIDREAYAIRFLGDILLSPKTIAYLESQDILERVRGATTILHEWWHSARTQVEAFYPFEEGTADVWAAQMGVKLFGVEIPNKWQPYQKLVEAVRAIGEAFDDQEWFIESRKQADVKEWLRAIFTKRGFSTQAISRVLSYTGFEDLWLQDVKRMIQSEGI